MIHKTFFRILNLGGIYTIALSLAFLTSWAANAQASEQLRAAEHAELEQAQAGGPVLEESEEDKLRKELDESKYQGM